MNSIQNVWKLLKERTKEKNPRNVEELWTILKGEWGKIFADVGKDVKLLLKVKFYTSRTNEL